MNSGKTTFYIETFGCQMNERDSETIAALLSQQDMEQSNDPGLADVIILNTCAVRESAESKVWSRLGKLAAMRREDPVKAQRVFVLAGCMAQLPSTLDRVKKRVPFINVLTGPGSIHRIPELVKEARSAASSPEDCKACAEPAMPGPSRTRSKRMLLTAVSPARISSARDESTQILPEGLPRKGIPGVTAYVTIMYGCDNFCSYCIVPYVRGPQVSRLPEDVLREVRELVSRGYKEVTLLGQNVNAFGLDSASVQAPRAGQGGLDKDRSLRRYDFASLLRDINDIQGLERVRYFTSHPRDFTTDMVNAARDCEKVCEHFHLPLQSGSNRLLKAMNRGYTKEDYLALVRYIEETVPGASITTDIIVGFPGETEEDFRETLDVVGKVEFDGAFTFIFSPRKGTAAAKMKGQVPKDEKSGRLQRLVEAQREITLRRNKALVGHTVEILAEDYDPKDLSILRGRTRSNKMVLAECSGGTLPGGGTLPNGADTPRPGDLVRVEIEEAGVWYLKGPAKGVIRR